MLEESISCSPGCETKRSQSRRLHSRFNRKHKRPENRTSPTDVSCLKGLYEESDHVLNSTQYEDFNPFQNEKLLAVVDMVRVPRSPSTSKDLLSRGFVKLEDLPIKDDVRELVTPRPPGQPNSELHAQYGPETQFGITESEFVRFCDDAEMDVQDPPSSPAETPTNTKTIVEMILEDFCPSSSSESSPKFVAEEEHTTVTSSETPRAKKSVVEAILEDFCASPYSESPPKTIAENATPIFRFRSSCIRTYAGTRRRRLRRNIDTELASAHLTDDDGSVSDSSGLSVQEDLTQSVVPRLDTVDLNSSIRVCENLLHLSSYFSQTTPHDKTPQSSEERRSRPLSEVVEEIVQLKRTSYEVTRRKSSDEFYGFSDGDSIEEFYGFPDDERKSHEDTLKELLDAEDDVLQHINCDSLCYETVEPKTSFSYVSEVDFGADRVKSVIDDAKKFMQSIDGKLDAGEGDQNRTICDSLKSLPKRSSQDSSVKEEALFEDVDLWNDNECLLNYVTQKPHPKQEAIGSVAEEQAAESDIHADITVKANGFGFSTASKKPIVISEEAKRKANEFWSKFEQQEKEREAVEHEGNPNSVTSEQCADDRAVTSTTSRKPLAPEAAKLKADRNSRQFEQEKEELKLPEALPSDEACSTSSFSKARPSNENQRKTNDLSDEVKLKAEELLKDIEFFEDGFEEEQKTGDSQFIACIEAPPSKPQFEGFKTASRKPIAVSNEAKRRADLLVKDVKAEDMPKDFLESLQADLKHDTSAKALTEDKAKDVMAFEGFTTASKKPIQISEVAKRRAEQISKDVQAADLPREFLECIQADLKDSSSSIGGGKDQGPADVRFEGFKTASKKPIQISEVAKRRAEQISKDVQAADLPREFLECIQADLKDSSSSIGGSKDQGPADVRFEGFKTASKKPIQISEVAKRRAEQISKDVQAADLPREFLECIQADLKDGGSSIGGGKDQGSANDRFEGFKTASKKQIQISDVAKQRAEQMLKEIQTAALPQDFLKCVEADLNDNSNSASAADGAPPALKPIQISDAAKQPGVELISDVDPLVVVECIPSNPYVDSSCMDTGNTKPATQIPPNLSSPQKMREFDSRKATKRKADILTGEAYPKSPKRRFSCNERTPLDDIENAPLHKTSSHPAIKSTQKMAKKNLLSLSKRKKCTSSRQTSDTSVAPKTPEKSDSSPMRCNANTTPNLKEFFDCVATSTPRLMRTSSAKADSNHRDSSIDVDFQNIYWENAKGCKTNTLTDLNVTCVQVSPSPKQRVERLKMYAEPPPISPILMVNKCRPSGLRRGRTLMKP